MTNDDNDDIMIIVNKEKGDEEMNRCRTCGREISDNETHCPICAKTIEEYRQQTNKCRTCDREIPKTETHCKICSKTIDEHRQRKNPPKTRWGRDR